MVWKWKHVVGEVVLLLAVEVGQLENLLPELVCVLRVDALEIVEYFDMEWSRDISYSQAIICSLNRNYLLAET